VAARDYRHFATLVELLERVGARCVEQSVTRKGPADLGETSDFATRLRSPSTTFGGEMFGLATMALAAFMLKAPAKTARRRKTTRSGSASSP
jgi:hypothetical protein